MALAGLRAERREVQGGSWHERRSVLDGPGGEARALSFADFIRHPEQARRFTSVDVEMQLFSLPTAELQCHVFAVFSAVLGRYCGQRRFGLFACFADDELAQPSVLAIELEPEASMASLASHVREALSAAEPAEPSPALLLSAAVLFGADTATENDLTLSVWEAGARLRVSLHYDQAAFEPATLAGFVGALERGSIAFRAHPERSLGSLALLTPEQERAQVAIWSGLSARAGDRPIHRLVVEQALRTPSAVAASFREQHLTYAELERRSRQLALSLQRHGVTRGACVAVCLKPSLDTVVCLLGVLRAGATYVPLDPSYPLERLSLMIADTDARVLLSQRALVPSLPEVEQLWCVEELRDDPFEPAWIDDAVELEQLAYIIYTSGTTGAPKGVAVTHGNLCHYVLSAHRTYGLCGSDVMPAMARATFSITMLEMFSMLIVGGRLIVLEREHVLDFRRLAETLQVATILHASPSLLRRFVAFVREHGLASAMFDGLRHVSSGGDMVPPDLLEDLKKVFRRAELFVIYGCSEVSCMGCTYEVPRDQTVTRSLVGGPFENVSVRLYDDRRRLVPAGVVGEIYFGGAGVARGYWRRDDLTRERFVEIDGQRFYRTGDLGRSDHEGQIEILGRCDFQLKLRGMRIEPGEIESILRSTAGVNEAVVAAKDFGGGEPNLVAYVVLDPLRAPSARHLREVCREKLPDYMVPLVFVQLPQLPVNLNQKIDRRALPLPNPKDFEALRDYMPPSTRTERRLIEIWEEVLCAERPIGIRDHFFEVGGSSLMSVTLMMEIERAFGRALPLSTLLTEPTVEKLAQALERPVDFVRDSLVLLRDGGHAPPLFLVHDGEGETLPYLGLSKFLNGNRKVYGILPRSTIDHPILHSRLEDIVEFYLSVVRAAQPSGPYHLGGLCIGGFIALEIARRLQEQGEEVALVLLLDAAHVHAAPKSLGKRRLARFTSALGDQASHPTRPWMQRSKELARTACQKIGNVLSYELATRSTRAQNDARMRLFRFYLDQGLAMPDFLKGIPVQVVLRFAEREYKEKAPYRGEVVLVRATRRSVALEDSGIDDTPYVENFASPLLGWEGKVESLKVFDAPGGHSSMLQSPNVEELAFFVQSRLDACARELVPVGQAQAEARESIVA